MAAIVLVVVLAGVAALLLTDHDETIAPSVPEPRGEGTPSFAFAVVHMGALPTAQLRVRKPVRTDPVLKLRVASMTRMRCGHSRARLKYAARTRS